MEALNLPMGYRFDPEDAELVVYYLIRKVMRLPLPANFIPDFDVYEHDAGDLPRPFQYNNRHESFFFVQTMRKYPNGKRPSRSTPGGHWKATCKDTDIWDKGLRVGFRKTLVYYVGKAPKEEKTNWIMQEYRLNPELDQLQNHLHPQMNSFVLCKIYDRMVRRASEEESEPSEETEENDISGEGTSAASSPGWAPPRMPEEVAAVQEMRTQDEEWLDMIDWELIS